MTTPLSLVVAFPKHAENGHHSKVLRCGCKPPEATALIGKELLPSCDSLQFMTAQAAFPQYTLDMSKRLVLHFGSKPQYEGPMWLFAWLHDTAGDTCRFICQRGPDNALRRA